MSHFQQSRSTEKAPSGQTSNYYFLLLLFLLLLLTFTAVLLATIYKVAPFPSTAGIFLPSFFHRISHLLENSTCLVILVSPPKNGVPHRAGCCIYFSLHPQNLREHGAQSGCWMAATTLPKHKGLIIPLSLKVFLSGGTHCLSIILMHLLTPKMFYLGLLCTRHSVQLSERFRERLSQRSQH